VLGENITYRPGVKMIKITTDPKVYAVSRNGLLRWVSSEEIAKSIFGSGWNQLVDDLPDPFFINYKVGLPIESEYDYKKNSEKEISQTINIDKGFSFVGSEAGINIGQSGSVPEEFGDKKCSKGIEFRSFLSFGTIGNEVKELQNLLQCLGYFPKDIEKNGRFGPTTEEAVKKFQSANGIEAAGYVGPSTREALNRY